MNQNEIIASLRDALGMMSTLLSAYVPSLLSAALLIAVGWILGRLLARFTTRFVDRIAPGIEGRAARMAVAPLGIERRLADVVGAVVFWAVFAIFVGASSEALGLPVFATWVSQVVGLLPQVLFGGLIVLAGLFLGTLARDAIVTAARAGGLARGDLLGRGAQGGDRHHRRRCRRRANWNRQSIPHGYLLPFVGKLGRADERAGPRPNIATHV